MHKQVIVMRKFKNLRTGKYIAQGAHAAIGAASQSHPEDIKLWDADGNTKIVVYVNEESEIFQLQDLCKDANIPTYVVTDLGRTEFNGATVTALAIGPYHSSAIDKITSHLPLF